MISRANQLILGPDTILELEHRCYNGVCFCAGLGCFIATLFNTAINLPKVATLGTFLIGVIYLGLYAKSRRQTVYKPVTWLYILSGSLLLSITWFYNAGINGADIYVSMVALVALTVILKKKRYMPVIFVLIPLMTVLFAVEYYRPDLIVGYQNLEQRFWDIYLSFIVATVVIFFILTLILKGHDKERTRLDKTNLLLKEKMEALEQSNSDLTIALERVKTLNGLLPICASCKKIRDDKGYWNQIESYLKKHSEAEFSHSMCPECSDKFYGKEDWYIKMKEKEE